MKYSLCGVCSDKEQYQPLVDVNWWSDSVLILARCSGAVTVSSIRSLRNLLGKSCEWFEPSPRVTAARHGGFLSLEVRRRVALLSSTSTITQLLPRPPPTSVLRINWENVRENYHVIWRNNSILENRALLGFNTLYILQHTTFNTQKSQSKVWFCVEILTVWWWIHCSSLLILFFFFFCILESKKDLVIKTPSGVIPRFFFFFFFGRVTYQLLT